MKDRAYTYIVETHAMGPEECARAEWMLRTVADTVRVRQRSGSYEPYYLVSCRYPPEEFGTLRLPQGCVWRDVTNEDYYF